MDSLTTPRISNGYSNVHKSTAPPSGVQEKVAGGATHSTDTVHVAKHSTEALNSNSAQHPSDPHAAKQVVQHQGQAAAHITGGDPHAAQSGEHGEFHGAEHGGEHHGNPLAHAGHEGVHIRHYVHEVVSGIHDANGWKDKKAQRAAPNEGSHTSTSTSETPEGTLNRPAAETVEGTPKPPVADTPERTPTETPEANRTPRRQPVGDDMTQMVDDLERNGMIPEERAATKPNATDTPESSSPVRKRPVSDDMTQMIEDMERNGGIPEEGAAPKSKAVDTPEAAPRTHGTDTPESAPKTAVTDTPEGAPRTTPSQAAEAETTSHGGHGGHAPTVATRVTEGALGATGVLFGGMQAVGGIQELAEGHIVDGSLNVAGGGGTAVGGAATLAEAVGIGGRSAAAIAGKAGAVGLIANGIHTGINGVNELREGKYVEGGLDVVGGAASVTGGGALLVSGAAAAPLAVGAAGVAAVADGLKTMYKGVDVSHGISNIEITDGYKVAGGAIKTAGGGMMIAGAATLNPALVVAGGVTYLGGMAVENGREIKDFTVKTYDQAAAGVSHAATVVSNTVSHAATAVADTVSSTAGAVADGVSNAAGAAVDGVSNAASSAWNAVTSWW